MSGLEVQQTYRPDNESIQQTNEKYEGEAGLYDVIVGRPPQK